jgi:hypothetical protein
MDMVGIAVGVVVGAVLGYAVALFTRKTEVAAPEQPAVRPHWWEVRKTLTGTQLQILQYMEAKKEASIAQLQEKFSFIPDRELYYRLEQIVLMEFVVRARQEDEVMYTLNPDYSGTVEDDKTVMLPQGE